MLTLLFQMSQRLIDELRGSFELLREPVSLLARRSELRLEVWDTGR